MCGPFKSDAQQSGEGESQPLTKKRKTDKQHLKCSHCGLYGHSQCSSHQCLQNKNYDSRKEQKKDAEVACAALARKKGIWWNKCATLHCLSTQKNVWY